jgi:general secretion pathway protein B
MSLILEALRKSEAERRRTQAPDLFAEPQLALPKAPRAWPSWTWPAVGLGGLIAAVLLLRALWPAAAPASAAHVPEIPQAPVAATTPSSNAPDRSEPAQVAPRSQPAPMPPVQVAVPAPAPPVANRTAAASPAPLPQPRLTPAPAPPAQHTPEPARPEPAPPPTPGTGDTLRLADLGAEERRQLPPLKLSMHMWNDTPTQRFVILDGQRLGEGDRIGDAVVEQITREGAILAWNGRRLALSMR